MSVTPTKNQLLILIRSIFSESTKQTRIKSLENSKKDLFDICSESIAAHLVTRPSAQSKEYIAEWFNKVKENSRPIAYSIFGNDKKIEIDTLIDEIEPVLPDNRNVAKNNIVDSVRSMKNTISDFDFQILGKFDDESFLDAVLIHIYKRNEGKIYATSPDPLMEMKLICTSYLPKEYIDAADNLNKNIRISHSVANLGKYSAGILAHEIAHILSGYFGKNISKKLETCLDDRYYGQYKKYKLKYDDEESLKYVDEDFADFFANLVLNTMGLNELEYNYSCKVMESSYNELNKKVYSYGDHPLMPELFDHHSSITFRAIQTSLDLGFITPICQEFVKNESGIYYERYENNYVFTPSIQVCE